LPSWRPPWFRCIRPGTNSEHGARRPTRPAPPGARGVPRRSWPERLRDPCRRPPGEFRLHLGEHVGLGQPPAVPHFGKDVAHAAEPVLPGRARRFGAVGERAARPRAPENPALFEVFGELDKPVMRKLRELGPEFREGPRLVLLDRPVHFSSLGGGGWDFAGAADQPPR